MDRPCVNKLSGFSASDLYHPRQIELAYLEVIALLPEAHAPSEEERAMTMQARIELDALRWSFDR